jgi:hypothetical protein
MYEAGLEHLAGLNHLLLRNLCTAGTKGMRVDEDLFSMACAIYILSVTITHSLPDLFEPFEMMAGSSLAKAILLAMSSPLMAASSSSHWLVRL